MERIARGKRASENQKEFLINFLEENVDVANDKFVTADGAKFRDEKWKQIAATLNALGGTQKDGAKWRKYWNDLRLHTRTKYSAIKQAEQRSGINGLSRVKQLSPLEERVIKITTVEAVDGDETPEVGFEPNSTLDRSGVLLAGSLDDYVEAIVEDHGISGNAAAAADISHTSSTIAGGNIAGSATVTCIATMRSKRPRKRAQPETPQFDKFFKIEERKFGEMEMANKLKREQIDILKEQIEATKKQTEAIKADTQVKEIIVGKLQDLFDILGKRN